MENKTVTKTEKKTWLEWSSEKSGVDADTIQLLYHAGIIPVEATRQPAQIALFFKTQHALGLNRCHLRSGTKIPGNGRRISLRL
jgi:hypothetical protein